MESSHFCSDNFKNFILRSGDAIDCPYKHLIDVHLVLPTKFIRSINLGVDLFPDHKITDEKIYKANMNVIQFELNRILKKQKWFKIPKQKAVLLCKYLDILEQSP